MEADRTCTCCCLALFLRHGHHFPSSSFHSWSAGSLRWCTIRAPSRRRANDLIREQWLSINNPVSPASNPFLAIPLASVGALSVSWLPTPQRPTLSLTSLEIALCHAVSEIFAWKSKCSPLPLLTPSCFSDWSAFCFFLFFFFFF